MATDIATPAPSAPAASAPPSSPPPSSSAPGGFNAKLDSMFDRISSEKDAPPDAPPDSPDGGESEKSAAPPEVVTADEPLVDEPAPEVNAAQPPAEPAEPQDDIEYAKEIAPDKVENGKYYTTKAKWERLQAADKTIQALRELDPGITVDAIKEMHGRTLALDTMLSDYHSGDPTRVTNVANAFTGADQNGRPTQNPQAVQAFADSIMANAAQYYPEAFKTVQNKILLTLAQQQYQKFLRSGSEADKMLAWNLEYEVHGARGNYSKYTNPQATGQAPNDPEAAERDKFYRDVQSHEFQKQQDRHAQITQAVNTAESEAKSVIDQAIEAALSVIPTNVREQKAVEYKHAVRDLKEGFEEATKANDNYSKPYSVLLSQLRASPTPEARSALVEHVKKWATWTVGRQKSEVVSRFSNGIVQQSKQAHAKQEKLQERREPGGNNGSPSQRATLQQKLHDPATKYDDAVDALFGAIARR